MFGSINNCHNVKDFRKLAKRRIPGPIFHYIDGAADDEITYRRNTEAFDKCDLVYQNHQLVFYDVVQHRIDWMCYTFS